MGTKNWAVFLDRDGVINPTIDRGDNCFVEGKKVRHTAPWSWDEFKLFDGIHEALQQLRDLGYLVILATNQPDVHYGKLTQADYDHIMAEVAKLPFNAIYVCLHSRYEICDCKKPKPGMLMRAAAEWNIDLARSYMIGDNAGDIDAAQAAGIDNIILIDHPYNQEFVTNYRAKSLLEAAAIISERIQV